jgi:hypothetical protein
MRIAQVAPLYESVPPNYFYRDLLGLEIIYGGKDAYF